jgi:hypothetical protein
MFKAALRITLILTLVALISSCAKVYNSPDAKTLASTHNQVAILLPKVTIAAKKNSNLEQIKEQQRAEAVNFQYELYAWMLKRKGKGKFRPEIQEIQTTNAILAKAGYPETPMTNQEICQLLRVDGLMTSTFALSKPISEGAAVALLLVGGMWGPTDQVQMTLGISDCMNKKLIWNYEHKMAGGMGTNSSSIVDGLMRNASKKMPYTR